MSDSTITVDRRTAMRMTAGAGLTALGVGVGTHLATKRAAAVEFDWRAEDVESEVGAGTFMIYIQPEVTVRWSALDEPAEQLTVRIAERQDGGWRQLVDHTADISGSSGQWSEHFNRERVAGSHPSRPHSSGGSDGAIASGTETLRLEVDVSTASKTHTRSRTTSFDWEVTEKESVRISGQANTGVIS